MNGGAEFRTMYCPMQFQRRLKIAPSRPPGGPGNHQKPWMGRYDGLSDPGRAHWCHFTYHTFSEDPGIPSWTPGRVSSSLRTLWDSKKLGQDPKPTAGNETIDKTFALPAGKKISLAEIDGAGSIASLNIGVEPLSEEALFQTWITMTWDGHSSPQVEAPLGAFFGGYRKAINTSFASLLFGYSPAGMYCYFPMPYWKSAKIEIENRGKQEIKPLMASIQYKPAAACSYAEKQCGYFCAITTACSRGSKGTITSISNGRAGGTSSATRLPVTTLAWRRTSERTSTATVRRKSTATALKTITTWAGV